LDRLARSEECADRGSVVGRAVTDRTEILLEPSLSDWRLTERRRRPERGHQKRQRGREAMIGTHTGIPKPD
jgi:hypothetical protein